MQAKAQLRQLLYEWLIEENCDYCKHLETFRDGDKRHPCNRCEDYRLFSVADIYKEDINEKVKQILNIVK